jgi:hypothetical protein
MPDDTAATPQPGRVESRVNQRSGIRRWNGWRRPSAGGSSQRAVWPARVLRPVRPGRLPVGYRVYERSLVFCIALGSPTDEDSAPIEGAEYKMAVEIDDVGTDARRLCLHPGCRAPPDSGHDHASDRPLGGQPTAGSARDLVRITPTFIASPPAPPPTSRQYRQSPALRPNCTQHRATTRPLSWKAAAPHHARCSDLCGPANFSR